MSHSLEVVRPGPLALVEDAGRPGMAQIGVGVSGAADRRSYDLANRLVGNTTGAAAIEVTLGGLEVVAGGDLWITLTGAQAPMGIDGRAVPAYSVEPLRRGERLAIGTPESGLRSYLAVRGGIDVPAVLGSRSADLLSAIGPQPLQPGDVLAIGDASGAFPSVDLAPPPRRPTEPVVLRAVRGPRDARIKNPEQLVETTWTSSDRSNRIGMRLDGAALLADDEAGQLPSEGAWRGAIQVPPGGQPVLFLADHPVTGGYPVLAVVADADVDRAAQVRPGESIRFEWWESPSTQGGRQ
ncbi:5-oxoprolinase subunit C family protein [Solicola gregarius]|uniref:Biotin-dependent carboxyltransferase family protein n=1 Tax=Solicola gregarius TaxID=2908642 RepID=A0AA46TIW1_9ACTN|nr:biotin-dependent carboxyltransferase family protein [Solicola gregarius]UYM05930.1 biotin-dependent carboxyltransferase family protein [Solicola gregarius]